MSGIYIPGMEMPTKGDCHMTLYVCGDGAAYVDVAELPADEDRFAAVPVPDHGRLIDADELMEQVEHDTPLSAVFEKTMRRYLHTAPTIIPGGGGQDDGH